MSTPVHISATESGKACCNADARAAANDASSGGERDPVCGMTVDPESGTHHAEHQGKMFHFCSARCQEKFVADPAHYLQPRERSHPVPLESIYTCPMHPQIRQQGP
ncbi:MAG: YHS domain-containing protein, partial [Dokdonella sp.]